MQRSVRLATSVAVTPVAFAIGGLSLRLLLRAAPHRIATDLAQPLVVVTAWGTYGALLWGIIAGAVAVSAMGTLATIRLLRTAPVRPSVATALVMVAGGATLADALSWPVVFSSDVYAYGAYGEASLMGLDPYHRLAANAGGPLVSAAAWQWNGSLPPCVYGPLFLTIARALVRVAAHAGPAPTLFLLRLVSAAAFLCAAGLFAWAVTRPGNAPRPAPACALAAFALNPVALWAAAEGHNDVLMLAVALAGAALALRWTNPIPGGVLIVLSSLIKAPGAAAGAALAAIGLWRFPRRLRTLSVTVALGLAAAAGIAARGLIPAAGELAQHGQYDPSASLQALAFDVARLMGGSAAVPIGVGLALAAAAAVIVRGLALLRARDARGIVWITIGGWLALPNPYPWYALWVLPVAAAFDGAPAPALWAASICAVIRYLPDAYGASPVDLRLVTSLVAIAPLLYALRGLRRVPAATEPVAA